ncbi:MAG: S-methyl-5-thioribose-1-phosphate isomerase [Betaproteobacteria bacterium TMED100]|nr:MAG: S-methyl-5-thioribose-1-phosphate isomerase [Betaproteobacteria bacterium TMED100]
MKKFETLEWKNNELILIDQRLLPTAEEYVVCKTVDDVADAIKNMVVRGAPAIGCVAAFGFTIAVTEAFKELKITDNLFVSKHEHFSKLLKLIKTSKDKLANTRPTAVNLFWALERINKIFDSGVHLKASDLFSSVSSEAEKIFDEDIESNKKIGLNGALLLGEKVNIMTHCNAGSLATAGHGTALGIIRSAHSIGKKIEVFAGETRPFLQGARLTAWELIKDGIPVTLITDNMSGYLMSLNLIDAVIVGADRVTSNGDVINKIGTYSLAVLASKHNIPFYVACPWSTVDIKTQTGAQVTIEERDSKEVTGYGTSTWAPQGIKVFNPAFDVTPANLVSYLVTERGVVKPNNLHSLKDQ